MLRTESVEQMVQILSRFRDKYKKNYNVDTAHIEAVKDVAQLRQLTYQNILDLCWRRLHLKNVAEFRNILEKWMLGDPKPLLECLKKVTPLYCHSEIEAVIMEGKTTTAISLPLIKAPIRLDESFSFSIDTETAKKLKTLSVWKGISTSQWLTNMMPAVIEKEYLVWLNNQQKDNP